MVSQKKGKELDLNNPKTFNEKIQWMKLYDSTEEKAKLADKLACRDWVKQKIGEQYLIPLLGDYESFDDINFDVLPDSFVLKTNHGSSTNIIVKNKKSLNYKETKMKLTRWLKSNYSFNQGFELHYGTIPPRIICEKHIGENPNDYKFFCFNGKPEFVWVDVDRHTNHCRNTYDLEWNELPFVIGRFGRIDVDRPKNLELMIELAKILSEGFAFVRVDFYEVDGNVYFGEMTFTTSSGIEKFHPEEYDLTYGQKIILPDKKPIPIEGIMNIWRK